MIIGKNDDEEDVIISFNFDNNLISYKCREPTLDELNSLPLFVLTSDIPWNPEHYGEEYVDISSDIPTAPERFVGNVKEQRIILERLKLEIHLLMNRLKILSGSSYRSY